MRASESGRGRARGGEPEGKSDHFVHLGELQRESERRRSDGGGRGGALKRDWFRRRDVGVVGGRGGSVLSV